MSERQAAYRNMLLDLSRHIDDEDLSRMKFRCSDVIRKRQSEQIVDSLQLFTALEERDILRAGDVEFLKELLRTCCGGKILGLKVVESYELLYNQEIKLPNARGGRLGINQHEPVVLGNGYQMSPDQYTVSNVIINPATRLLPRQNYTEQRRFNQEFLFLSKKLGKDWKFFMRALGVHDDDIDAITCDYQTTSGRVHQCLLLWLDTLKQCASRQKLIEALRHPSVRRNDLAEQLEVEA